jgi:hypothetical protein
MAESENKQKVVLVSIRVISPFYVKGNVARVGEIVEVEELTAAELIHYEKAERAQDK